MTRKTSSQEKRPDDALAQRVARLVQLVGGQGKAAEIAGVGRTTIQEWRSGTIKLPLVQTALLARAAGVSLNWLAFGDGSLEGASGERCEVWLRRRDVSTSGEIIEVPDADWNQVPFRRDYLEHYGVAIDHAFAMVVPGDEMKPTINETDIIVADTSKRDLTATGIYAFLRHKRLMVLRAQLRLDGGVTLAGDNESYGVEELKPDAAAQLHVVGRVMVSVCAQIVARK